MADWCNAPDHKSSLRPDQGGIGLAQRFTGQRAGLFRIHLVATCGDEQDRCSVLLRAEDDGFGDLINLAPHRGGGLSCRAGAVRHLYDFGANPGVGEGSRHPFHAF